MTTGGEQKEEGEGGEQEGEKEYDDLTAVSVSVSEERYCGKRDNSWYMYAMQKHSG